MFKARAYSFLFLCVLLTSRDCLAQRFLAPISITVDVSSGLSTWEQGDGSYPLIGSGVSLTLANFLVVGADIARTSFESSPICTLESTCDRDISTPQTYAGFHLQIEPPVGRVRPFVGVTKGRFSDCAPTGSCGSTGFEGGLRGYITNRVGLSASARRRSARSFNGTGSSAPINEFRLGAVLRVI